jgi:hypothetical protein
MSSDHEFAIGDVVWDREKDHGNPAVVVNLPPKQANEWEAYTNTTVAEDNPDYPKDSKIIVVAYRSDLSERAEELLWPDSPIPLAELNDYGVKHYAFPVDRLRFDAEATPTTTDTESDTEVDIDVDDDATDEAEEQVGTANESTTEAETDGTEQRLQAFQDYLTENGVRSEVDDGALLVEKLGQNYRLVPGEVLEGDGPYRDRLEDLAADAPMVAEMEGN